MLIFRNIKWKNFLSTGNSYTEVYLDKYDTTLVSGDNGAGKSTILDVLTYGLFGKSFRGINVKNLVNSVNEKECVVEVSFSTNSHDYKIVRGMKPKIFEIYKDGSLVPQNATIKDYQNVLEEQILKMSYKAFCQVVILGSSNYIPFMKLPTKDRKTIVEDLLDINIFSIMNGILKSRLMENKDKTMIVSNKTDVLKSKIESQTRLIRRMEEKSKESVKNYSDEIDKTEEQVSSIQEEVATIQKDIKSLMDTISDKNNVENSLSKAEGLEDKLKRNIKKVGNDIKFYEDNNSCPTCYQEITEEHREKEVLSKRNKIDEIDSALKSIQEMIEESESRIGEINEVLNKISGLNEDVHSKNSTIHACNQYIKKMRDNIQQVSKDREELDAEKDNLTQIESEHSDFDDRRKVLVDDRTDLELIYSLLRDTGIKSKIIKYYLPIMNRLINKYLKDMDFFCQFSLDENFDETIKSRFRDDFTYFNFSEGERLRIDLSLLLAWREIARLKNSVNCNLLLLDEVFDSSLDSVGTEEFLKILNSLGKKANVFVITHKADQLVDKFENSLHFIKKGNFSEVTFRMHKDEN